MADLKIAFWNLQNLFDTTLSDLAADFEFTPANGWDEAALAAKIDNLAEVVNSMFDGTGPDLLGLCEVENAAVAQTLIDAIGRPDLRLAHVASPDIRGIDTSLIYSANVFAPPAPEDMKGHMVHLRYPTRDIFEVHLRVLANDARMMVLVNHWPSRRLGQYETEPHRMTVAEHCGRLVDAYLKFDRDAYPEDTPDGLARLNERWDRNVLMMGDLNDEPYDRSVLHYLLGSRCLDHLEDPLRKSSGRNTPELRNYLARNAYLFNCMWPLLGRPDIGTHYFADSTNSANLLDQFLVSRGLYYGKQGLRARVDSATIHMAPQMTTAKSRPRPFDKATRKGYSDHFPITFRLEVL